MRPRIIRPSPRIRLQIQDVLALIVGYAMAALFVRALWPSSGLPASLGLPALALYLWLGLAMSGPMLLWRRESRPPGPPGSASVPGRMPASMRTWAEWAWLFIGMYWILMGLFLIPSRLGGFRFADALLYGLVPVVVAVVLRLFAPPGPRAERPAAIWTHLAAVGLLITWPIAWACLMILGRYLP
jgi:hypothetical protein